MKLDTFFLQRLENRCTGQIRAFERYLCGGSSKELLPPTKGDDKMIQFSVNCEPIPQPRPRFSKFGVYEPKRITEYKEKIKAAAKSAMAGLNPMTCAVKMTVKLYRKFVATSRRFGDFDNHAKSICDALNKIVFADDSQIVSCTVEKFTDKENPRVEVEVEEI